MCGDTVARSFWTSEFAAWNSQFRTEAVSSVTNKLLPFLTSRQLRAITAAKGKHSLDLRRVMDQQRVLLVNLGWPNSSSTRALLWNRPARRPGGHPSALYLLGIMPARTSSTMIASPTEFSPVWRTRLCKNWSFMLHLYC